MISHDALSVSIELFEMLNKIKNISLFSGAGGLDFAFENTGNFETRVIVELKESYIDSLRSNKGRVLKNRIKFLENTVIINEDIKNITPKRIIRESGINVDKEVFIIHGGPPCQSFSVLGKRKGLNDDRGSLVWQFCKVVKECKPNMFVFENVPGLVGLYEGEIKDQLINEFTRYGYHVSWDILNAADYGAYTLRKRFILIGTIDKEMSLSMPVKTHGDPSQNLNLFESFLKPWNGVGSILNNFPMPSSNEGRKYSHHREVQHTKSVKERFQNLKHGERDYTRKRNRLHPDRPSPSLIAGGEGGFVHHIHYAYPRELTSRECALIQGFPPDYEFRGTSLDVAKQVVNAVPIELGRAIAKHIYYLMNH